MALLHLTWCSELDFVTASAHPFGFSWRPRNRLPIKFRQTHSLRIPNAGKLYQKDTVERLPYCSPGIECERTTCLPKCRIQKTPQHLPNRVAYRFPDSAINLCRTPKFRRGT